MKTQKRVQLLSAAITAIALLGGTGYSATYAQTSLKRYLPVVMRENPAPPTIFGMGVNNSGPIAQLKELRSSWVRFPGLDWQTVEPTEGARNWSAVANIENDLKTFSDNGLKTILIIQRAPVWARSISNSACGPVNPAKYAAMGKFFEDAAKRYSAAPFNVEYIEFWNEPDMPQPGSPAPDDGFGCWGLNSDPYFNGREFGQALKAAYEGVKRGNPKVKVLVGGLLMNTVAGVTGKFFDGVLQTAGGSFDGVSFHAYDNIVDDPRNGDLSVGKYFWGDFSDQKTGPSLIAKAKNLRDSMQRAGVSGKFLMNTEGAIIRFGASLNAGLFTFPSRELTKQYYIPQEYSAAIAEGLVANIWYSLTGWNGSSLVGSSSFEATKFAESKLGRATYVGKITPADVGGIANVLGYKFTANGKQLWVVWAHDGVDHAATFAQTPSAIYDPVGASVSTTAVKIGPKTLYIEY
jgi:hypothetical protein